MLVQHLRRWGVLVFALAFIALASAVALSSPDYVSAEPDGSFGYNCSSCHPGRPDQTPPGGSDPTNPTTPPADSDDDNDRDDDDDDRDDDRDSDDDDDDDDDRDGDRDRGDRDGDRDRGDRDNDDDEDDDD